MSRESHVTHGDRATQQRRQAQIVETALERLRAAQLEFEPIDEHVVRVAGAYDFWPASGLWKSLATGRQGYGIAELIELAKLAAA